MKKILVLLFAICLLLSLAACKERGIGTTGGTEPDGTNTPELGTDEPPVIGTPISFDAQYTRTDGYHEGFQYPKAVLIRSVEELRSYYESNKELYCLESRDNPGSDSTIGFLDACEKYDAAFFDQSMLVMVLLEEGSGSTRHTVDAVELTGTKLNIHIDTFVPEFCTCDMAQWHIFVEVEKMELFTEQSVQIIYGEVSDSMNEPATITIAFTDGKHYTLDDKTDQYRMLKEHLVDLEYDTKAVCNCSPEYKVEIEGEIYGINISEGYARCSRGQAFLSREQVQIIGDIIEWAANIAE